MDIDVETKSRNLDLDGRDQLFEAVKTLDRDMIETNRDPHALFYLILLHSSHAN